MIDTIMLVTSQDGEWEALYIDGELQMEGQSLHLHYVLELFADLLEAQFITREEPDEFFSEMWEG